MEHMVGPEGHGRASLWVIDVAENMFVFPFPEISLGKHTS